MKFSVVAILIVASLASSIYAKDRNNKPHKVVCNFESWAAYHKGDEHFVAEDINPNVCTHVNYAFAVLHNNSIAVMDKDLDVHQKMIERMVALRKHNPHLTAMISLGGWSEGSTKYSEMVRSESHRKHFVQSIVSFLQKYDLDGVDLDWEYPGFTGVGDGDRKPGRAEDKADYVTLLKELKEAFKPHGYLLSAAVAAGKHEMERAYDIPGLSKYLDFINLMTYDYHGEGDGHTGFNAPLSAPSESAADKEDNVHFTVDYWLKHGADPKKLILGIPLYGKGFKVTGSGHDVGVKATAGHSGGNYGKVCQTVKQHGWTVHWHEKAQVPYAVNGHEWVSFDNLKSVQKKLDYVLEMKLGGSMVWPVDGDDVHGHCGDGKYPLMKLQMKVLNKVDVADVKVPKHN